MIRFLDITYEPGDSVDRVRKLLLDKIIIILNVVGLPLVALGVFEAMALGHKYSALSYVIYYSLIISATIFRKRLSLRQTALFIIVFGYLLAISNLVVYGFGGAGLPIFLTILVFATIFFDVRAGLYTVLACVAAMSIVAFLYVKGFVSLSVSLDEISTLTVSWITAIAVLAFLGSLIVLSFGIIQRKMMFSIETTKDQAEELKSTNQKLEKDIEKRNKVEGELRQIKDQLEKIVKERTRDLEDANKELVEKYRELESINKLFKDREFRIKELRDQLNEKLKKD